MKSPGPLEIEDFLRAQYRLWNDDQFEEMKSIFRDIAPNGVTIQYVGQQPLDGWQALDEMWEQHGGRVKAEIVALLVNGNEAATYILNHMSLEKGVQTSPSIETYLFEGGTLSIRYFHQPRD
jgi:hypothetical protein